MIQLRHAIIQSTDENETEAVAIIDRSFALPVERQVIAIPHEIGRALTEASASLTVASELHDQGHHREAFKWAIRASHDLFRSVGFPPEQLEPYKHLFDALGDLDNGSNVEALKPADVQNRRVDTSEKWKIRACLAIALELRMRFGESEDLASTNICSAIPVSSDAKLSRSAQCERLKEWRRKFKKGRVPEGQHRIIFTEAVGRLDKSLVSAGDGRLTTAAESFLDLARKYRVRAGLKAGG